MAAPSLVAFWSANASGASQTSASLTLAAGDTVIVVGGSEGATGSFNLPTCSLASNTFVQVDLKTSTGTSCAGGSWKIDSVTGSGAATFTLSQITAAVTFSLTVYVFRGASGVGAHAITAAPSATRLLSLTALQADSSIVWGVFDYGAVAVTGGSPTSTTHSSGSPGPTASPQEVFTSQYTRYLELLDDQPSTSAVSYGITGSGTGPFTILALEVKAPGPIRGLVGTGSSKAAATTLAVVNTTGAIIPAGTFLHIAGCWDNIASVTAPTITCSTVGGGTAIANHATAIGSGVTTTAGSGVWHQCFRVVATADIAIGATIATLTSNQSAVARAAHAQGWSGINTTLRGTVATGTSTTGSPSVATTGTALVAGDLVIGSASFENSAQMTGDADTLNGTWGDIVGTFTTGSTANTNTGTGGQAKAVTATGAQTYNPTGGVADTVACVYSLAVVPAITAAQKDFTNADWVLSAGATSTASRLTVPASGVAKTGLSYTLSGTRVFWKVTQLATTGAVKGSFWLDANNYIGIRVGPGASGCQNQKVSGGTQLTSPTWTWDAAKPYVSISEVGGTISFDRSADGLSWENISTTNTNGVPWTISGSQFQFDGLALTAGSAFVESLNAAAAPVVLPPRNIHLPNPAIPASFIR